MGHMGRWRAARHACVLGARLKPWNEQLHSVLTGMPLARGVGMCVCVCARARIARVWPVLGVHNTQSLCVQEQSARYTREPYAATCGAVCVCAPSASRAMQNTSVRKVHAQWPALLWSLGHVQRPRPRAWPRRIGMHTVCVPITAHMRRAGPLTAYGVAGPTTSTGSAHTRTPHPRPHPHPTGARTRTRTAQRTLPFTTATR